MGRGLGYGNSGADFRLKYFRVDLVGKLLGHLKHIPGKGGADIEAGQKDAQDIQPGLRVLRTDSMVSFSCASPTRLRISDAIGMIRWFDTE